VPASKTEERLEGGHRRPPAVEAEGELVEVGLKVSVADTVVSSPQPRLEVPEHSMDAGQDLARPPGVTLRAGSVAVALLGKRVVGSPAVREHHCSCGYVRPHEAYQRPGGDIGYHFEPDATRSLTPNLHSADNDRLVNDVAPTAQARFWPANVGLVHLDSLFEELPLWPNHGAPKFLEHGPRRLVAPEAELALELESRESRGLSRDQVGGPEPLREWDSRPVQNRSRCDRGVVTASPTTPQEPSRQLESLAVPAPWALEALGPSTPSQVQTTRGLVGEQLPKLVQRPRILRAHRARRYPLGSVESTG